MARMNRRGFTFVEILTAMALFAVLAVIAWARFNRSYENALRATLMSDLRNTTTAQEIYHELNATYATDISQLQPQMNPSPESQIHITNATATGWAGWNEIRGTDEVCEIYVGSDVASSLGFATTSEQIFCQVP